jgi:Na+/proline symporter
VSVLIAIAVLSVAAAVWGARHARATTDYFAAGRRAGAWMVGVAGTAAAVSAFTFVGGPGLFVTAGIGSLWITFSAPLTGALQCWAVGEPIVDLARKHGLLTPQELIGLRFGAAARGVAGLVVIGGCVASLAVQARAAAVLGEDFLGVPGVLAAGVALFATTAYTAAGGMRVGLFADAVQGGAMGLIAVVLAVAALARAGGPAAALATLASSAPGHLGSFGSIAPATAMAWFLLFCVGTCAQPHYLQKFFFLKSRAELRRLPAVLTGALAVTLSVWLGVGLAGSALVRRGEIVLGRPDDVAPRTIALLGPWAELLAGIAILAALMSTASSFLNLTAAAATRDIPTAFGRREGKLWVARLATVLAAACAVALGVQSTRTVALLGVAGWGLFTAALLPVFTLGLRWPGATPTAAATAILVGASVDVALELVRPRLPAGLEPGLAGAAIGMLTLVAVSALARQSMAAGTRPSAFPPATGGEARA